jgi:DNA-binding NarL/FixJ family response regulator
MTATTDATSASPSRAAAEPPLHVLCVDDFLPDLIHLRHLVRDDPRIAQPCPEAGTLADARRVAADRRFDLVLLDLGLPDATGVASVRAMREAQPSAWIVVLSGNADLRVALGSLATGANDYVEKDRIGPGIVERVLRDAADHRASQATPVRDWTDEDAALARCSEPAMRIDLAGHVRFANEAARGFLPQGSSGTPPLLRECFSAREHERVERVLEQVLATGEAVAVDLVRGTTGRTEPVCLVLRPVALGRGEVLAVRAMLAPLAPVRPGGR